MEAINRTVIDQSRVARDLFENGFSRITGLIDPQQCRDWIELYTNNDHFRKTISMARYRFGSGEYKYFSYPLPPSLASLRSHLYPQLMPIANQWNSQLGIHLRYPETHDTFLQVCHQHHQTRPTPLLLKYGPGDFNTLHQDLYGEIYFPLQVVIMLSESKSYSGGQLVFTEQVPRAQSKATVLTLNQGDAVIFTTRFRPQKGSRGYYRVTMKHGVSEVHEGERYTLGIIFHDAT